jgi:hypothetical protein
MKKLVFILMLTFTTQVLAQTEPICMQTNTFTKYIQDKYSESLVFMGFRVKNQDAILSVWLNPDKGTATVLRSSLQNNVSCLVEVLQDIKVVAPLSKKPKSTPSKFRP